MIKRLINILNLINKFVTRYSSSFGAWASIITIISLPILLSQLQRMATYPDVDLEFSSPSSIIYTVNNRSATIAEDTLVAFTISDIDSELPSFLPIPIQQIDYVNAKSSRGPWAIFEKHAIKGHRYFGLVYVGCRGTKDPKTYWIFTKYGDPGESFYVKRKNNDPHGINLGKIRIDKKYLEEIAPLNRRIYIKNK